MVVPVLTLHWRFHMAVVGMFVTLVVVSSIALQKYFFINSVSRRTAYCGASKDVFSRAMTAKFVLEQLTTQERAAAWHYPVSDCRCRLCGIDGTHENLRHLLLDCSHPKICDVRRNYVLSMVAERYLDNQDFSDFLVDTFQLRDGRLRCLIGPAVLDDTLASDTAFGFVRGFWAADLILAVRRLAPDDEDSTLWFTCLVRSFARAARNHLWRPVWDVWRSVVVPSSPASSISTSGS